MERIRYERKDGVGLVTLDDGKANAMQGEFIEALGRLLDSAEKDAEVGALVLTGRPGFFSAGLDLKVLPTLPGGALREVLIGFFRTMLRVHAFPKPVVAAVNGHALAGGCVLALACDQRLGAEGSYRVGLSEVAVGIALPSVVIELASPALNPVRRREAMLFGRVYDPAGAREVGFLHELCPPEALLERALSAAAALAALPGAAFVETKRRLTAATLQRGYEAIEKDIDGMVVPSSPFGS
jgi:enoyl-CoA hydratase